VSQLLLSLASSQLGLAILAGLMGGALLLVWRTQHGWRFVVGALTWTLTAVGLEKGNIYLHDFGKIRTAERPAAVVGPLVPIHCYSQREICASTVPYLLESWRVKRFGLPRNFPTPSRFTVVEGERQVDGSCSFARSQYEKLPRHSQVLTALDERSCMGVMAQTDWRATPPKEVRADSRRRVTTTFGGRKVQPRVTPDGWVEWADSSPAPDPRLWAQWQAIKSGTTTIIRPRLHTPSR
jgi:hypothetical protein